MTQSTKRDLAHPLPIGAEVPIEGRVKECASLVEAGNMLLDIGCSSAWLAPLILAKGFQRYIGLDRAIVGSQPVQPRAKLIAGSLFELPFQDAAFDAVCLFDVIEHLPRGTERRALSEINRVLRIGGKLYFSTPHASPLHTLLDPVWLLGHRHYRRPTIVYLLASSGFELERLFVAGGLIECIDHIRLLAYKHILHRPRPTIRIINRFIEHSHGGDHSLGMTLFAVASRRSL